MMILHNVVNGVFNARISGLQPHFDAHCVHTGAFRLEILFERKINHNFRNFHKFRCKSKLKDDLFWVKFRNYEHLE